MHAPVIAGPAAEGEKRQSFTGDSTAQEKPSALTPINETGAARHSIKIKSALRESSPQVGPA